MARTRINKQGDLAPIETLYYGDHKRLAEMFGVSRTTVRNSLTSTCRSELNMRIRTAALALRALDCRRYELN